MHHMIVCVVLLTIKGGMSVVVMPLMPDAC